MGGLLPTNLSIGRCMITRIPYKIAFVYSWLSLRLQCINLDYIGVKSHQFTTVPWFKPGFNTGTVSQAYEVIPPRPYRWRWVLACDLVNSNSVTEDQTMGCKARSPLVRSPT